MSVGGECPPGYYCEPLPDEEVTTPQGPVPTEDDAGVEIEAVPEPADGGPSEPLEPRSRRRAPTPPVDAPRLVLLPRPVVDRPGPPAPKEWPRVRLQGRFGVPLFDGSAHEDAGMVTAGGAVSYAWLREIELDGGMDLAAGTDSVGAARRELWCSGSLVLSPRARGAVPDVGFGPSLSFASSELRDQARGFAYLGAHLAIGASFDVSERSRVHLEWIGFLRGRVDDDGQPEYVDYRTGRATNTSGGAVVRLGFSYGL